MEYTKFERKIIETLGHCEDITEPESFYSNIRNLSQQIDKNDDYVQLNKIFEGLSNPDRLKIVYSLIEKDRCSCEFQGLLQKSQPAVSRDVKKLEEIGLIKGWKKGNFIHYSLVKPKFNEFLQNVKKLYDTIQNWFGVGLAL